MTRYLPQPASIVAINVLPAAILFGPPSSTSAAASAARGPSERRQIALSLFAGMHAEVIETNTIIAHSLAAWRPLGTGPTPDLRKSALETRMATSLLPSVDELRQLLDWDLETGLMTWRHVPEHIFPASRGRSSAAKAKAFNTIHGGKPAFNVRATHGYLAGTFRKKYIYAHRVILALHVGSWHDGVVDHINGIKDDNRISNLRGVTQSENSKNAILPSSNKTGRVGVYRAWNGDGWAAAIGVSGQTFFLGNFKTFDEAAAARQGAERVSGFTHRHGSR